MNRFRPWMFFGGLPVNATMAEGILLSCGRRPLVTLRNGKELYITLVIDMVSIIVPRFTATQPS